MKKLITLAVILALLSSCRVEFGARLGGYKAPRHLRCVVGGVNYWGH